MNTSFYYKRNAQPGYDMICQGHHEEAEAMRWRALEFRKRILAENHPETMEAIRVLAWSWHWIGKDEQEIDMMEKATDGFKAAH